MSNENNIDLTQLKVEDLEKKYEGRKAEYIEQEKKQTAFITTKGHNINTFKELYNSLDDNIKKVYGLELEKPIDQMNLDEIKNAKKKFVDTYASLFSKLDTYLRTGKVESLDGLIPIEEDTEKSKDNEIKIPVNNQVASDSNTSDDLSGLKF